jgi:hypothetical protein
LPRIFRIVAERIPALNSELQNVLNPPPLQAIQSFGTASAISDKVMQLENDYDKDVYNGDIGFVCALDHVMLAYATTVHKAQGCEYPAVVIPVTTQHDPMLQRNLICTGITRRRKLAVLVGQTKALAMAVRGSRTVRRWAKLGKWLARQTGKDAGPAQARIRSGHTHAGREGRRGGTRMPADRTTRTASGGGAGRRRARCTRS